MGDDRIPTRIVGWSRSTADRSNQTFRYRVPPDICRTQSGPAPPPTQQQKGTESGNPCAPGHPIVCSSNPERSALPEKPFQLGFGALQLLPASRRQIFAGAIDIENEHRQGRTIGIGLAAMAAFSGMLEGGWDLFRV